MSLLQQQSQELYGERLAGRISWDEWCKRNYALYIEHGAFPPTLDLATAREMIRRGDGIVCPCCGSTKEDRS